MVSRRACLQGEAESERQAGSRAAEKGRCWAKNGQKVNESEQFWISAARLRRIVDRTALDAQPSVAEDVASPGRSTPTPSGDASSEALGDCLDDPTYSDTTAAVSLRAAVSGSQMSGARSMRRIESPHGKTCLAVSCAGAFRSIYVCDDRNESRPMGPTPTVGRSPRAAFDRRKEAGEGLET